MDPNEKPKLPDYRYMLRDAEEAMRGMLSASFGEGTGGRFIQPTDIPQTPARENPFADDPGQEGEEDEEHTVDGLFPDTEPLGDSHPVVDNPFRDDVPRDDRNAANPFDDWHSIKNPFHDRNALPPSPFSDDHAIEPQPAQRDDPFKDDPVEPPRHTDPSPDDPVQPTRAELQGMLSRPPVTGPSRDMLGVPQPPSSEPVPPPDLDPESLPKRPMGQMQARSAGRVPPPRIEPPPNLDSLFGDDPGGMPVSQGANNQELAQREMALVGVDVMSDHAIAMSQYLDAVFGIIRKLTDDVQRHTAALERMSEDHK